MGSRGPIPDPSSGRSKAGRNTRTKKVAAPAPAAGVAPPASVTSSPAASGFWSRNAPALVADGRLTPDRVDAFAILCQLHADCEQLAAQVATEGWITATDKGQAASPVARLLRDSRRDFVTLARDFGLTAAAAARLPQDPSDGKEEDDEAALLRAFTPRQA